MPTALAMDRTRACTYTFENSSKCRIPLTSHPYLCTFHARKDAEERATDEAVRDIAFHLSNRYISHCDLSAAIAQTITAVAYNHIPVRTAATIAYLTQNLVQSLAGAEKEFKDTFGIYAWRQTIADNFNAPRPNSAAQPAPAEPAATAPQPVPTDDRADDPASTPATDAATDPQIPSAQPLGAPQQTRAENTAEKEAENGAESNSKSDGATNSERAAASGSANGAENNPEAGAVSNPKRTAMLESQTTAESPSESTATANPAPISRRNNKSRPPWPASAPQWGHINPAQPSHTLIQIPEKMCTRRSNYLCNKIRG